MSTIVGRANPLAELRPANSRHGDAILFLEKIVRPADFETIDAELIPAWRVAVANAADPFEAHVFPRFEELVRRARKVQVRVVEVASRTPSPVDVPAMETVGDVPAAVVGAPIYLTGLFDRARHGMDRARDRMARAVSYAWARVHDTWRMSIRASALFELADVLETVHRAGMEIGQSVVEHTGGAWDDFAEAFGSLPTVADLARSREIMSRKGMLAEPA